MFIAPVTSIPPVFFDIISDCDCYICLKEVNFVRGFNCYGQLGDGTTTDRSTPAQVSGLTGAIKAIAADAAHTAVLKEDGTIWTWGYNYNGQLGDGTTTNRATPAQVSGLIGIKAVAAGDSHTVAVKEDGTVWAWGYNYNGQLGDGTTTD